MTQGYVPVPITYTNEETHRRLLAEASNRHNQAKFNCTLEVTLAANASSTLIKDARIAVSTVFLFMPTTAHASVELASGNLYVPESTIVSGTGIVPGQAAIQHTNNSQTDRIFRVGLFG